MFYFGPINYQHGQDIKGKQVYAHVFVLYCYKCLGGAVISTIGSQTEGPGFDIWPGFGACCVVCMISLCLRGFPPGCFGFLPHSQTCKVFIGYSKLPVGVRDCLSLCQPCDKLAVCPGLTLPSPTDVDIGSCEPA